MKVIYSPDHARHSPLHERYDDVAAPHADTPDRVKSIVEAVGRAHEITMPQRHSMTDILAVHAAHYVEYLRGRSSGLTDGAELFPSYYMSDTYTPLTSGTFDAAVSAVDVALSGADELLAGEGVVYAVCRPPGHHAEEASMGGYCYLNNAAVAAQHLTQSGRVAILDIDFHHGNGTQALFYTRSDVLYVSMHADPALHFPYRTGYADESGTGAGRGYTVNLPLAPGTSDDAYLAQLAQAIEKIERYGPDFLLVSAGFDTYKRDPIGTFALSATCYRHIGASIASVGAPSLLVQEGGYNVAELGNLAANLLSGFDKHQPI